MKYLVIREYWEKVDRSKNLGTEEKPFYAVKRGEYELKSYVPYRTNMQYMDVLKRGYELSMLAKFIPNGYQTQTRTDYGIKSYQTVTLEENKTWV